MPDLIPTLCLIDAAIGNDSVAADGALICQHCFSKLNDALLEIVEMYTIASDPDWLTATVDPCTANNKSRAPMSLHAVSLTDVRTRCQRPGDPISAPRVLTAWLQAVYDMRGYNTAVRRRDITQTTQGLLDNLHWVAAQPAVTRFARHIMATRRALAFSTGGVG